VRRRFWLAVARFAVRRTDGHVLRPYREPTDEEWAVYADEAKEWAELTLPAAYEILPPFVVVPHTTTTLGAGNITWRQQ
jgi:hypothetical protein